MTNLHYLEFNADEDLVLEYEPGDAGRDFYFESYFGDMDGFVKKDSKYILPHTPEMTISLFKMTDHKILLGLSRGGVRQIFSENPINRFRAG